MSKEKSCPLQAGSDDKCPFCGAGYRDSTDSYKEWRCGTRRDVVDGYTQRSDACYGREVAALQEENAGHLNSAVKDDEIIQTLNDEIDRAEIEVAVLQAEVERLKKAFVNGGDPDFLGAIVRMAWVEWARRQENPKASWLISWADLDEVQKQADREIGMAVAKVCVNPELIKVEAEVERLKKREEDTADAALKGWE